jgi:uncharacterized protein (DUF58 family)
LETQWLLTMKMHGTSRMSRLAGLRSRRGEPAELAGGGALEPPNPWIRLLHYFYSRSSQANYFLARRIRPPGIACAMVILISSLFSLGNPRTPVFQLFSFTLSLTLISLALAFLRRARLQATRILPRHGTVGQSLRYPVRVVNLARRRLRLAWLGETIPDPRPDPTTYGAAPEPGESKRNPFDRLFLYYRWRWQLARRRGFDGGDSAAALAIPAAGTATAWIEITPRRRGVVALDDLRVLLPDPLGLFQRCRRVVAPPATLTVLPRRYRLPAIDLPGAPRFQLGGETASRTVGTSDEFLGLREYRPGDPLRLIHWRSWARTGRPIVRELEDTFFPRHGLVLDTFPAPGRDAAFEEAVSVAASFASTIDRSECLLDLMFVQGRAHRFTAGRGVARAEKMLEVLAAAQAGPRPDFPRLARLVLRHRDDLGSCLCVLADWDEPRADFLRTLIRGGLEPLVLVVAQPGHALDTSNSPAPTLTLTVGRIEADLRRLPGLLARQNLC